MAIYKPSRKASGETKPTFTLTLDFQTPELWEINFCCLNHPVFGILLWQPSQKRVVSSVKEQCGPGGAPSSPMSTMCPFLPVGFCTWCSQKEGNPCLFLFYFFSFSTLMKNKYVAFLCTNNEKVKREIQETITITITSKWMKYLGINLSKETKYLYSENYKILLKEI